MLALALNHDYSILITGDTKGFLYLWNIENSKPSRHNSKFCLPRLLRAWRCHDMAISSCQYIKETDEHITDKQLIVTTSMDWSCRLWNLDGAYIGAFGQEQKWNLANHFTHQSLINLDQDSTLLSISSMKLESETTEVSFICLFLT